MRGRNGDSAYLTTAYQKDGKARGFHETDSPADSLSDLYGPNKVDRLDDSSRKAAANEALSDSSAEEESKWIHRDKLARIENEELQAAGIVLPSARERARSKSQNRMSRRDPSRDGTSGTYGRAESVSRSRKNSVAAPEPKTPVTSSLPTWDLRLPEEIEDEEAGYWVSNEAKGVSKIPVAKTSPAPIPSEHLERDKPKIRRRESSPDDENTIVFSKTRSRSNSTGNPLTKTPTNGSTITTQGKKVEGSPTKKPAMPRKASGPKPANGAPGRPRTRGGPSKDSTSSGGATTRPSTRSGERELTPGSSKPMEGDPPWMVSAFIPDPRLPPDQQLLPTVARRLQQEKWEREGKVSSIYDKEFRPLSDEFLKAPEPNEKLAPENVPEPESEPPQGDWPLKAEKSPSLKPNSYSTMPRISDKPNLTPLPSPRTPVPQTPNAAPAGGMSEPPEELSEPKGGCGCCVVM